MAFFSYEKSPFASKTIWAGVGTILVGIGGLISIFADGHVSADEYNLVMTHLASIFSGGAAIWGRSVADKSIGMN